jgi:hypothetical protein
MPGVQFQKAMHGTWLMIAMLALALRIVVPAGFMLTPTDATSGYLKITLCTADGNRAALMAPDGSIHDADDPDSSNKGGKDKNGMEHSACTFAGSSGYIFTPAFSSLTQQDYLAKPIIKQSLILDLVPGRGLAAPPPPATASPTLF